MRQPSLLLAVSFVFASHGCALASSDERRPSASIEASIDATSMDVAAVCYGVTLVYGPEPGTFVTLHFVDEAGDDVFATGPLDPDSLASAASLVGPLQLSSGGALYVVDASFEIERSTLGNLPSPDTDTYDVGGFVDVTGEIAAALSAMDTVEASAFPSGTAPAPLSVDVSGEFVASHCVERDRAATP